MEASGEKAGVLGPEQKRKRKKKSKTSPPLPSSLQKSLSNVAPWPATCSEPTPRNQEECLASPLPIPAEEEARPGGVCPLPGYRASATWQLGPKVEPLWRGRLAPSPPWPGEAGAFVCRVLYFSAHILFCLYKRKKIPSLKTGDT